jgi:hypothetical protein
MVMFDIGWMTVPSGPHYELSVYGVSTHNQIIRVITSGRGVLGRIPRMSDRTLPIAHPLGRALLLPGYGVAALTGPAMQNRAAVRAMEPVAQWWRLALELSELNPASFECLCRQTVRLIGWHLR